MTIGRKVLIVFIVFLLTSIFSAQALFDHKLGVWSRDWSNGAPSGEVMFVDNARLEIEKPEGAERYAPKLACLVDNKWKEVRRRAMEDRVYTPFVGAPWFILILPVGNQQFRLTLGKAESEITVDVQRDTIHVVSFLKTNLADSATVPRVGSKRREMIANLRFSPIFLIPRGAQKDAEAQLREALSSQEPGVRYRACRELERLREKTPLAADTVEDLQALLKKESIHLLREGISKALGKG